MKKNKIYFGNNWGFSIGQFEDNLLHKHYAIQINISLNTEIILTKKNNEIAEFKSFLIKSNVTHQLSCEKEHLLLLFYPTSPIGHYLNQLSNNEISEFKHPILKELRKCGIDFLNEKINFENVVLQISSLLDVFKGECETENFYKDERIKKAIKYLEANFNRVISLKEIAKICFLSESRFLHLFKENTGITFRKVQQWNKVSKSFSMLRKQNLTETAHQFGFTDSSHYSKVFKETFGFNPKLIQKS
ncbi:AraC family transcriptional regulator [Tenacibaculum ovolyticum]|uniref:helix-turn-helix domain-containing protein n=1 Tax=Tenacibaculum ovolyticum TaxID=104270 RepID=UPI0004183A73|nr:AraC family transcriptional regulator [Tenacibaculum ovolyticum]WBX75661.1 AraC family transcriptional regulator [Tenacibaculum ovolyticum]